MYKLISKNFLFLMDAEKAHHFTMTVFRIILSIPLLGKMFKSFFTISDPKLETHLWGLKFKNPVGLAAGFDKDGKYFESMQNLGFGFIEIGTVTPVGQAGNDKPRLFRLPADEALINRMGFNNDGVEALVTRLKKSNKSDVIIGGNIGKNKVTPNEEAVIDYLKCFEALYEYVDYFVVNVSSPNTPGLRELQDKEPLTFLLKTLVEANKKKSLPKPILLKIAPDLTDAQLDDIVEIVFTTGIQGVIATNTTIDRSNIMTNTDQIGAGGLSGKPLAKRSTEVIQYLTQKSKGQIKIIGVGGISSPEDAIEKLEAGACLVQVYSGLVYYGPTLVKDINRLILSRKKSQ